MPVLRQGEMNRRIKFIKVVDESFYEAVTVMYVPINGFSKKTKPESHGNHAT